MPLRAGGRPKPFWQKQRQQNRQAESRFGGSHSATANSLVHGSPVGKRAVHNPQQPQHSSWSDATRGLPPLDPAFRFAERATGGTCRQNRGGGNCVAHAWRDAIIQNHGEGYILPNGEEVGAVDHLGFRRLVVAHGRDPQARSPAQSLHTHTGCRHTGTPGGTVGEGA